MKQKIFILFFILFSVFSYAAETKRVDLSSDIKPGQAEKNVLYIKTADQITYSQEVDGAGYSRATLYGNVYVLYEDKQIYADHMVIKFYNKQAKEVFASGNVIVESNESIIVGDKFFFYPDTETGLIYNAETYNKPYFMRGSYFKFLGKDKLIAKNMTFSNCDLSLPHFAIGANKAWVYKGDKDMFLGFYIKAGQDPIFYFPFMHRSYYGTGLVTSLGRAEGMGWFVNNTYQTKGEKNSYELTLMLDYYQKIGEYAGLNYKRSDIGTLDIKTGIAYDRHVKYENDRYTNYFEEVLGEGPVSGRSTRYKFDVSYNRKVIENLKLFNDKPLNVTATVGFSSPTDPYFSSQFETNRSSKFDAQKILFPEAATGARAPARSDAGGTGKKINFSLNNSFYGFTLDIKGDWIYKLSKTDDPDNNTNPYRPEYYENFKDSITFPSLKLSRNFTNIWDPFKKSTVATTAKKNTTPAKPKTSTDNTKKATITWPISLNASGDYTNLKDYEIGTHKSDKVTKSLNFTLNWAFSYNDPYVLKISAPISIANTNKWEQYDYDLDQTVQKDLETKTYTLNPSIPFSFTVYFNKLFTITVPAAVSSTNTYIYLDKDSLDHSEFLEQKSVDSIINFNKSNNLSLAYQDAPTNETIKLALTFPLWYSYQDKEQVTTLTSGTSTDEQSSYIKKSYLYGIQPNFEFLKDYEYLETRISGTYSIQKDVKDGYSLPDSYQEDKTVTTYSAKLTTLKSDFSISTSTTEKVLPQREVEKNNLLINANTKLIPYFEIQNNHEYNRELEKSAKNTLTIKGSNNLTSSSSTSTTTNTTTTTSSTSTSSTATKNTTDNALGKNRIQITDDFWINAFTFNIVWSKNYLDYKLDYLTYSFGLEFYYTKLWKINFSLTGKNNKLYLYSDKAPADERRDLWKDFVTSLKFWSSTEERQNTKFVMDSFSLKILHDLHKWNVEFSSSFKPVLDTDGGLRFESTFLITFTLKDLPNLKPPDIKKEFGKK